MAEEKAITVGGGRSIEPPDTFEALVGEIGATLETARGNVARKVNTELLAAYWNIGRLIVEYEQGGSDRAAYGDRVLSQLSKRLTASYGKGFSKSNIYNMRELYLTHQIFQTLSGKLTWSHYCTLLDVSDPTKRSFYEHEAANAGWSVRELRRQMDSLLFERVVSAKKNVTAADVAALAEGGIALTKPADVIKDPYVLEFLDLPDTTPLEGKLEAALVAQIEKFLLELGRGFMFVGTQQRVPVGPDHDRVDMVFYNKPLRAYVLIELKTTRLMAAAVGQMNEYLNYYAAEVNDPDDNPPIGIILCTDRNNVRAEYALGGLSNAIFASTYTLRLPDAEQLEAQVRKVLAAAENDDRPALPETAK
ncbi:MAG: YhcG family protein [Coriobacteriales bacterium]